MNGESQSGKPNGQPVRELVFLGSSGAIQIPAFFCSCKVCEAARRDPKHHRTRASLAVIGQEITLVDASPDLEFQLEREAIRRVDRVFVTHWHYDHVSGLAALAEPSSCAKWPPIDIFLPREVAFHFEQELAYMRPVVNLHLIQPGDKLELPDATWQVVKTTHTDHSVGFIVESGQRFAYLVDGVVPPPETLECLEGLDFLILEATLDELLLEEGERWLNFALQEAVDFWQRTGIDRCVLTHLSCHAWRGDRLVAGLSYAERMAYEAGIRGLTFAHDGMRVTLQGVASEE